MNVADKSHQRSAIRRYVLHPPPGISLFFFLPSTRVFSCSFSTYFGHGVSYHLCRSYLLFRFSSSLNSVYEIINGRIFQRGFTALLVVLFFTLPPSLRPSRFLVSTLHTNRRLSRAPIARFVLVDIVVSLKPLSAARGRPFSTFSESVKGHSSPRY